MKIHFKTSLLMFALVASASIQGQTPDQLAALKRAKTDSLTAANYQQALNMLGVKLPILPSMVDDPNRPESVTQRVGSTEFFDKQGNHCPRSPWGGWINFDENIAKNYSLPNPLVLKNGKPVTSAAIWWKQRRPEIVNDYESEIFGRVPKKIPKVTFEVTSVENTALDGAAIKKMIVGHIDNSAYPAAKPVINIALYLPTHVSSSVPLMLLVSSNTNGNLKTIKLLNSKGWAVAIFDTNSLQADNGAGLNEGIIGLINKGKYRTPENWGVLRAWSWGMSRALDYFQTEKAINPKQFGIEGHSRGGKTALLAGAMDARWAIVYASCSGSMGASLERRNFGETVGLVAASNEFHWMAPNFLKYGGNFATTLPVDAHEMMALIAPRPLFITGGTQDSWADPKGEFDACVAATPVYKLLGQTGITVTEFPAPNVPLINGELAYRFHEGGHTDEPDWPVFLEFASKYIK